MKPKKLTKQQKAMCARIADRGGLLMADDDKYVDQGGQTYHGTVVKNLIALGQLQSNEDAMFGAKPQSYRLVAHA